MSSKDISYLQLWWPFCLAEQNHLDNFGRGHNEVHFFEIIIICTSGEGDEFKDISDLQLWQPFCSVEQNHLDMMRYISVELL